MNRAIAARTNPQVGRSYWTTGRTDNARAFRAARRHSKLVRMLRVAVPLAVALAVVTITLTTYFNPLRMLSSMPVNIGSMVIHGTKVTMEQPKMSGFTRDARAYVLTADSAAQDLTKPDMIELNNLHAQVQMKDKSTVRLSALKGLYDSKKETLQLNDNILLNSSNGYTGRLSEAKVDIKKGDVVSDHPVQLEMLQGTLDANRLHITDHGDLVHFDHGVKMTLMLNKANPPKPAKSTAAEAGAGNGAR